MRPIVGWRYAYPTYARRCCRPGKQSATGRWSHACRRSGASRKNHDSANASTIIPAASRNTA